MNRILKQTSKQSDKSLCKAVERLTGVLGGYIVAYNDAVDCLRNNLQVQKQSYLQNVVSAIDQRIMEIKKELKKLQNSNCLFLTEVTNLFHNTAGNVEINDVSLVPKRVIDVKPLFDEIKNKALETIKELERLEKEQEDRAATELFAEKIDMSWWDAEDKRKDSKGDALECNLEVEVKLSEESMKRKNMVILIQAQEKSRVVIGMMTKEKQRRQRWEKELLGTLQIARPEIRERAATIIKNVCKKYIQLKRKHIDECRREEILGMKFCKTPKTDAILKAEEIRNRRQELQTKYEEEWKSQYNTLKEQYIKLRSDDLKDDCREEIREWFAQWYKAVRYFYDIPKDNQGGSCLITKDEVPTPEEWEELYLEYLKGKKADKNKSSEQKKREKKEANQEKLRNKQEEKDKLQLQERLRKKMMKDPNKQIPFDYPESKYIDHITEAINNYKNNWKELDTTECLEVKEKSVLSVTNERIYMEVKTEIRTAADADMRLELKKIRKALKAEYKRKGEEMPEKMKQNNVKNRKIKKVPIVTINEDITGKLEELLMNEIIKEYPRTKIEDFIGDHNLGGQNDRCSLKQTKPFGGEIRQMWWEQCQKLCDGFSKILVVGPRGSGKTILTYALASLYDAVLFEIDPKIIINLYSTQDLKRLALSVALCARAVQPSIILIKHVQRFYYKKTPSEEKLWSLPKMRRFFVQLISKKINKNDKIMLVGTCVEPWVTKSKAMLKQMPQVILTPDSNYPAVVNAIKDWMKCNREVPHDFNYHGLARCLRGFQLGHLKNTLQQFLDSDRIVKIAAQGLSPLDVYEYFIEDGDEAKTEYDKYHKWYMTNTHWGIKEKKHLAELLEIQEAIQQLEAKKKKNKKG